VLLHDIGKIGIPDGILLKPGRLSVDEWKIMRTHPELGRRLVERIPSCAAPCPSSTTTTSAGTAPATRPPSRAS
jgi:HD-GYP domain-containing protein (c-di-GMP phosphodiesterase class II)